MTLYDAKFFGSPVSTSFIETRIDYSTVATVAGSASQKNSYISFQLFMDDTHKSVTRKVFTMVDAFSQVGGFMTIIFLVTLIFVQRIQSTIYFSTLIKSFYKYQPELL